MEQRKVIKKADLVKDKPIRSRYGHDKDDEFVEVETKRSKTEEAMHQLEKTIHPWRLTSKARSG